MPAPTEHIFPLSGIWTPESNMNEEVHQRLLFICPKRLDFTDHRELALTRHSLLSPKQIQKPG